MFIADACALIIFPSDPLAASVMPRSFLIMRNAKVAVSPISVWEIARKVASGMLHSVGGKSTSLSHLPSARDFGVQPLTWEDAEAANRRPPYHKDPVDRMLIATALRGDMTVITNDLIFPMYGVKTVW